MLPQLFFLGFISPRPALTSSDAPAQGVSTTPVPAIEVGRGATPVGQSPATTKGENATVREEEIPVGRSPGPTEGENATARGEETPVSRSPNVTEDETGERGQITHPLSEPVITIIVFGVIAAILGTVISIYYCVLRLRK